VIKYPAFLFIALSEGMNTMPLNASRLAGHTPSFRDVAFENYLLIQRATPGTKSIPERLLPQFLQKQDRRPDVDC
jgi:hypothetical protein